MLERAGQWIGAGAKASIWSGEVHARTRGSKVCLQALRHSPYTMAAISGHSSADWAASTSYGMREKPARQAILSPYPTPRASPSIASSPPHSTFGSRSPPRSASPTVPPSPTSADGGCRVEERLRNGKSTDLRVRNPPKSGFRPSTAGAPLSSRTNLPSSDNSVIPTPSPSSLKLSPTPPPPPRPSRSPFRAPSPIRTLPPFATRRRSATVATVQGCEFEMIEPLSFSPPSLPSPPPSPPQLHSSSMRNFIFPPLPLRQSTSPPIVSPPSDTSFFRLDRPHALPETFIAARDSLSQEQVDALTAQLEAVIPSSWSQSFTSHSDSGESRQTNGRGQRSESDPPADPEEWARQRRLSSILSGLGMVLGSVSLSSGALLMQDEEPEQEAAALREELKEDDRSPASFRSFASAQSEATGRLALPHRVSDESNISGISGLSGEYESADEGESWLSRRSSHSSLPRANVQPVRSRRTSVVVEKFPSTLATIVDTSPLVPSPPPHRSALPEVSYGYACGAPADEEVREDEIDAGAEADEEEEGSPSSIGSLVRRSWRRPPQGPGGLSVDASLRAMADDGLGIDLASLELGGAGSKRTVRPQSTYRPSSRPLQSRAPATQTFAETSEPPLATLLPSSPPLIGGLSTLGSTHNSSLSGAPSLAPIPSLSPLPYISPALSPAPSVSSSTTFPFPEPSVVFPLSPSTSSTGPARSPQVRSASFTSTHFEVPQPRLNRRASDQSNLGRRKSVILSSKSSKRLSALITTGLDIVRNRTSSHNSAEGDEVEVMENWAREARRRSRTDGPISAPLPSSAQFSPAPPCARHDYTPSPQASSVIPSPVTGPPSLAPSVTPSLTTSPHTGRTWRSTLSSAEYERLSLNFGVLEMRRQEVIWELCETERSFVNGLRGVIQVFTLRLRTRSGAWIKGVPVGVSRLLNWLDDIVYLHSQISTALDAAREAQSPVVVKLADAFIPFVSRLEVHQPYLVRFEAVTRSIDEMTADSMSDFGEFVRMQSSLPECGSLSLSSFLLKPVQRLMKFPLFFRQLCDLTPSTHPDHFSILTLLHSTDSMIRVMQEVKTREDEYEEAKLLASRIANLPEGFHLAARDRRLVAHGVLRRVHINDRDRGVLEMDAMSRVGRRGAALRGNAPLPPRLSIPPSRGVESNRPPSAVSDSGSSSITNHSDSSGWTPPTTPGSALPSSAFGFPHLRPNSMVSNNSSTQSDDFAYSPTTSAFSSASTRAQSAQQQRLVKTKAKESSIHVFVFSDLVVLATKHSEQGSKFMRGAAAVAKAGTSRKVSGGEKDGGGATYRVLEGVGVARVLGVADLSGKTEHDHLIEVDLLPILKGQSQDTPLSLSNTSLATSIYFTIPSPSSSNSARSPSSPNRPVDSLFADRVRWLQAFERAHLFTLRSLSFPPTLHPHTAPLPSTARLAPSNRSSYTPPPGILPKSPSEQAFEKRHRLRNDEPDLKQLEREERGWWSSRLKKVRDELSEGAPPLSVQGRARGGDDWVPSTPSLPQGKGHASGLGGMVKGGRVGGGGGNPGLGIDALGLQVESRGGLRRASG